MPRGCRQCYGVQSQVIPSAPEAVPIEGDEISPMAGLMQQEQLPPPAPPPSPVFVGPNDADPIDPRMVAGLDGYVPSVSPSPFTAEERARMARGITGGYVPQREIFGPGPSVNVPTTSVAPPNEAELPPMLRGTQPCC